MSPVSLLFISGMIRAYERKIKHNSRNMIIQNSIAAAIPVVFITSLKKFERNLVEFFKLNDLKPVPKSYQKQRQAATIIQ